jgi:hypothetical protein
MTAKTERISVRVTEDVHGSSRERIWLFSPGTSFWFNPLWSSQSRNPRKKHHPAYW